MEGKIKYNFTGTVWQHSPNGGWVFVSLPKTISKEIRENLQWQEEGWGRMKVLASTKNIEWQTAIWFDTKSETYLLPLKAEIRKKAFIQLDDTLDIQILV